jgi:hypothetical protein
MVRAFQWIDKTKISHNLKTTLSKLAGIAQMNSTHRELSNEPSTARRGQVLAQPIFG